MKKPLLIAITLLLIGTVGVALAIELTVDEVRGSSNRQLCSYSQHAETDTSLIVKELQSRAIDCDTLASRESETPYIPDKPPLAETPPALTPNEQPETLAEAPSVPSNIIEPIQPITPQETPRSDPLASLFTPKTAHTMEQMIVDAKLKAESFLAAFNRAPLSPVAVTPPLPSPPMVYHSENAPNGVVRISTATSSGSGFYIEPNLIVTNAHVVGDAQEVSIRFSEGMAFNGSVRFRDETLDFATIYTGVRGSPLPIRHTAIGHGEKIEALGFPQGRQVLARSTGTILDHAECCVEHDALIAGGSSGGPLLDAQHRVIGLNTLLSKKPGDQKNESDRAITIRMDYIEHGLMAQQSEVQPRYR